MSVRDRGGRAAQMRAERVRWRGRSRSMSQASRNMKRTPAPYERAGERAGHAPTSSRGEQRELAREVGRPPRLD